MRKKRGVLKLWMAIVLTFAAIAGVVGATCLTLFLMGRFKEEVVPPEDVFFSQEISENDLAFIDNGKLYAAADFKLTIASSTENVSQTKVELRLNGAKPVDSEGNISNGVIKVPQFVTMNKPFSVVLEKDEDGWIIGGEQCTITAISENVSLVRPTLQVNVDVPVKDMQLSVHKNSQSAQSLPDEVQDVTIGVPFALDVNFLPENAKNCFGTSEEKQVFFSTSSTNFGISYNFETKKFTAVDSAEITAYAFVNAYYQHQFFTEFEKQFPSASQSMLAESVITHLTNNPTEAFSKTIKINAKDATINVVNFKNLENINPIKLTVDSSFTLVAGKLHGDAGLGIEILDDSLVSMPTQFGTVGIRLDKNSGIRISGGKVMKVVKNSDGTFAISQENASDAIYENTDENTEYYVLPNIVPVSCEDYYWTFSSQSATTQNIGMKINLFSFDKQNNAWKNFFNFEQQTTEGKDEEKTLFVNVQNSYEEPPKWKEPLQPISLEVGKSQPLSDLLLPLDKGNTYQTVKYFLVVADNNYDNVSNSFSCKAGVGYAVDYLGRELSIENEEINKLGGQYILYELYGNVLSAIGTFTDDVRMYVVAAIVKTDANDDVVLKDGKYQIVSLSRAKQILVSSRLSIANMTASYTVNEKFKADESGRFNIPAINFDESGAQGSVLGFVLNLKLENTGDEEKLLKAFGENKLRIQVVGDSSSSPYVSLGGLVQDVNESTSEVAVFKGAIFINEQRFISERTEKDISLQLVFEDAGETHVKNILNLENPVSALNIYYQRPNAEEFYKNLAEYETVTENGSKVLADYLSVMKESDSITLQWMNNFVNKGEIEGVDNAAKIAELNKLFDLTMVDQYKNPIDRRVYDIRLEEECKKDGGFEKATSPLIIPNNNFTAISDFAAAKGEETYLAIYVVDKKVSSSAADNFVYTDASKTQRLTLPKIKFVIDSVGMRELWKEKDGVVKGVGEAYTENDYEKVDLNATTTISKYVTSGDEITMQNLLKIYTGNKTEAETGLIFTLATTNNQLCSMIAFRDESGATIAADKINTTPIASMQFLAPFGRETTLRFFVTNASEIFDVELEFVCKASATISYNFKSYGAQSKYAPYLTAHPTNGNIASVFAGVDGYSLGQYLQIESGFDTTGQSDAVKNKFNFTWANGLNSAEISDGKIVSNQQGLFYNQSGQFSIDANNLTLSIADVFSKTVATFTLYYGVHCELAPYIVVQLYLIPNIVVREIVDDKNMADVNNNPFVNVAKLGSSENENKFAAKFKLYRATSFIERGSFDDRDLFKLDGNLASFTYKNVTEEGGKYVEISGEAFVASAEAQTLKLELGQLCTQSFEILDLQQQSVDAIRVRQIGNEFVATPSAAGETRLFISLGFGATDVDAVEEIFSESIPTVVYDGKTHLLFGAGNLYPFNAGYSITDSQCWGDLHASAGNCLQAGMLNSTIFSPNGNARNVLIISKKVGNLTVEMTMRAIVSHVGNVFVQYENQTANSFNDVDFKTLIGNDVLALEQAKVSQTLSAGAIYQIVFDSNKNTNGFGFYFNGADSNIQSGQITKSLAIEKVMGKIGTQEKDLSSLGLAEILRGAFDENKQFVLNEKGDFHLKLSQLAHGEFDEVYVVLRFELHNTLEDFAWFFRVKVNSSFTKGNVRFPYAKEEDAEYLDAYSGNFTAQNGWQIELNEIYTNGNHVGLSRFIAPQEFVDEKGELKANVQAKDEISSVTLIANSAQEEVDFNAFFAEGSGLKDGVLTLKPKDFSQKFNVCVTRTYFVDGKTAIGSSLTYVFKLNQGEAYSSSIVHKQEIKNEDGTTNFEIIDDVTFDAVVNKHYVTLKAGTAEQLLETEIKRQIETGGNSPVSLFDAYVDSLDGTNLEDALQRKILLKAGTEVMLKAEDDSNTTFILPQDVVVGEWVESEIDFKNNTDKTYDFTFNNKTYTYTLTENNLGKEWGYVYAYLESKEGESAKTLHLKTRSTVEKDQKFEVGFFTNQKVATKLLLTVESGFDIKFNKEIYDAATNTLTVEGNKTYAFNKMGVSTNKDFIFDSILGAEGDTITKVEISSDEEYNAQFVEMNGIRVRLNHLVNIKDRLSSWEESTITFAHILKAPVTFKFDVKISFTHEESTLAGETSSSNKTYSFSFFAKVNQPSFNLADNFSFVDGERFGGMTKSIPVTAFGVKDGKSVFEDSDIMRYYFGTYRQVEDHVAEVVGEKATLQETYTIWGLIKAENPQEQAHPSDKYVHIGAEYFIELFKKEVTYSYTSLPNVELVANHPNPAKAEKALDFEVVSVKRQEDGTYSEQIENFFASKADFVENEKYRIAINSLLPEGIAGNFEWSVNVAQISNGLSVQMGDGKAVSSTSNGKTLDSGEIEDGTHFGNGKTVKFTLAENTDSASVTFEVTVNKVTATYTVKVVKNGVVKLVSTIPTGSVENGTEIVYAEDYAKQNKNLFEAKRLLKYTLLQDGTYHLKFARGSEVRVVSLTTAQATAGTHVIDLGRSFEGFTYENTYASYNSQTGAFASPYENENVFAVGGLPFLTARIVAVYSDGTHEIEISKDWDFYLKYEKAATSEKQTVLSKTKIWENLDGFTLKQEDVEAARSLNLGFVNKAGNKCLSEAAYSVQLRLDFTVLNNADSYEAGQPLPTFATLNAITEDAKIGGQAPTLFSSQINNVFEISRTRVSNTRYTKALMEQLGGRISLKTYGFETLPIAPAGEGETAANNKEAALKSSAMALHQTLINFAREENGNSILYSTGLTPRAGAFTLNSPASGTNILNYVVLEGNLGNEKATDWTLWAQGASNDGNFVMMRVTYSVDLGGGEEVSQSHNLLFKVLPNSQISFKNPAGGTASTNSLVEDGHTIYTNKSTDRPYEILEVKEDGEQITLKNADNADSSVISARMQGSTNNSINQFKFTYKIAVSDGSIIYNNWAEVNNSVFTAENDNEEDNGWKAYTSGKIYENKDDEKLLLKVSKDCNLGSKYFFVDFEDDFGFKGRFYFTVTSANNPKVDSIQSVASSGVAQTTTTLEEGSKIVFGANHRIVTATSYTGVNNTNYNIVFKPFTYTGATIDSPEATPSNSNFMDTISIDDMSGAEVVSAHLSATLAQNIETEGGLNLFGATIEKTISKEGISKEESSKGESYSFEIYGSGDNIGKGWTYNSNGEIKELTFKEGSQAKFAGATIVLSLKVERAETSETQNTTSVALFDATYLYQPGSTTYKKVLLEQNVTETASENLANPSWEDNDENASDNYIKVNINGIKAFAYENSAIAAVKNKAKISNFQNLKITKVEFFTKEGKKLGESGYEKTPTTETTTKSTNVDATKGMKLYTNNEFSFISKDETANVGNSTVGNSTIEDWFIVPTIDSIHFGDQDSLSGVEMVATITDDNEENSSEIRRSNLIIKRKFSTDGIFNKDVIDNAAVTAKTRKDDGALNTTGSETTTTGAQYKIYNDTLTVDLQPNESISFVVDDNPISKVDTDNKRLIFNVPYEYFQTKDVKPVVGKTYYTLHEEYVLVKNLTSFEIGKTYYVKNEDGTYAAINDATPQAGKEYYLKEISYQQATPSVTFEEGKHYFEGKTSKTAKIITCSAGDYARKDYVGISANIVDLKHNFQVGSLQEAFYVKVLSHTRFGKDVTDHLNTILYERTESDGDGNTEKKETLSSGEVSSDLLTGYIAAYNNNITLHIADQEELGNSDFKTEELFFLIQNGTVAEEDGKNVYQHKETFNIHPTFVSAGTSGQIEVNKYQTISDGNKTYNRISLGNWAKGIKLLKYGEVQTAEGTELKQENAYMFRFEIDSKGGAAFIDENGLITTDASFGTEDNILTVRLYMKFSGADGQFESFNTNKLLKTFTIRLTPNGGDEGEKEWWTDNLQDKNANNKLGTFVCEAGETLDLHEMFDNNGTTSLNDNEVYLKNLRNKTYHVVSIKNTESQTSQEILTGNLDKWTFNETGRFEVNVVVTYRVDENNSKDKMHARLFHFEIIVYDKNSITREERYAEGQASSGILTQINDVEIYLLDSNSNEIEFKNGKFDQKADNITKPEPGKLYFIFNGSKYEPQYGLTEFAEGSIYYEKFLQYNNDIAGRYQVQYLVVSGNEYKLVTYTFFVYGKEEPVNVATTVGTAYPLANLIEKEQGAIYEFYENGVFVPDQKQSFGGAGVGAAPTRSYILVATKDGVETLTKITAHFKLVGANETIGAVVPMTEAKIQTEDSAPVSGKTYYTDEDCTQELKPSYDPGLTYYYIEHYDDGSENYLPYTGTPSDLKQTYYVQDGVNGYKQVSPAIRFEEGTPYYEKVWELTSDNMKVAVAKAMGIDENTISSIQVRDENGILEDLANVDMQNSGRKTMQLVVNITENDGNIRKTSFRAVSMNFFAYETTQENTDAIVTADRKASFKWEDKICNLVYAHDVADTAFNVSSLAEYVRQALALDEKANVSFSQIKNGVQSAPEPINLDVEGGAQAEAYYVSVNGKYYLFNITIKVVDFEEKFNLDENKAVSITTIEEVLKEREEFKDGTFAFTNLTGTKIEDKITKIDDAEFEILLAAYSVTKDGVTITKNIVLKINFKVEAAA